MQTEPSFNQLKPFEVLTPKNLLYTQPTIPKEMLPERNLGYDETRIPFLQVRLTIAEK